MEFGRNLALFLMLSVCSVSTFPSKPLNDRSSELTWQAWLLVDSQNQPESKSDRRITPKSVFIVPKLDQRNDSLPNCTDGYSSDNKRCIKLLQVDEVAHLEFILSQLNQVYGGQSEDLDEESDESMPTTGPLQVNIPLGQSDEAAGDDSMIIKPLAAESNGQFDEKVNVKRQPDKPNTEQVEIPPLSDDYDYEDDKTDKDETTQTEPTTTVDTTTEIATTPTEETTEITEAATNVPNEDEGLKALFFLTPVNSTTQKNETSSENTPKTQQQSFDDPHKETEVISPLIQPNDHHKLSNFRFPDDEKTVKFPDSVDSAQPHREDLFTDNFREYYTSPGLHKPHSSELTAEQIEHMFRQYMHRPSYVDRRQVPHDHIFNHRNRDKSEDLWSLTPTLREEDAAQKLLVLRLGGRYPSTYYPPSHYDPRHMTPRRGVEYYGEEMGHGYSNLYGRKRKRGSLR